MKTEVFMQLSESEKRTSAQKVRKRQKKAGVGVVLTKTLCLFPKAKKRQSLRNFEKCKKKAVGVEVATKTRLSFAHREFYGAFSTRAPLLSCSLVDRFFLFYYKNSKRLPRFFRSQLLL